MSTPPPLRRVGLDIIVLLLSASASHQLLRDPLLKCFLFPRSLAFDFCYDLDIWGHGQALRAFFVVMSFFFIKLSKYEWGFDQTWQEAP